MMGVISTQHSYIQVSFKKHSSPSKLASNYHFLFVGEKTWCNVVTGQPKFWAYSEL